ncbi:hypothetical protein [Pseudobacteriovorax antillogorgiicola]|uniref:hypothetical protein n=1 Tax=Pseudobacteriovorax antillogorgiicola TaxID=1513793 RepID=UPI001044751B|nr:hypothetical protein [Pseudobacteriovorax antillogorgiicola]
MKYSYQESVTLEDDPRILFLKTFENFSSIKILIWISKIQSSQLRKLLTNSWLLTAIFKLNSISTFVIEWGHGLPSTRPPFRFLRWLKRSFWDSSRTQHLRAAKNLRIRLICLPHGVNLKENFAVNKHVATVMAQNGGSLPFQDRNVFDTYVFANRKHMDSYIKLARMEPSVARTWGSARFSEEWIGILSKIYGKSGIYGESGAAVDQRPVVLFFSPKWHNNVNRTATLSLLAKLAKLDISLIIKYHPRLGVSELEEHEEYHLSMLGDVTFDRNTPSISLVLQSDIVLDLGSSISLDAIQLQKPVIYPKYLHTNELVFEKLGAVIIVKNETEALDQVNLVQNGGQLPDKSNLLSELVYGGVDTHNVLERYSNQIIDKKN